MTVGEWLALLERQREVAWGELRRLAERGARTLTRGSPNAAHEAEELAAEVVAELLAEGVAGLRRAQPEVEVWSWLVAVLRNRFASGLRSKAPLVFGDLSSLPAAARQEHDPDASAVAAEGVPEHSAGPPTGGAPPVRTAWEGVLTAKQREAYVLFECAGLSIAEIARRLGLDWHTVHDRLAGALRRLRDGPPNPAPDRGWALSAAEGPDLDEGTRLLLRKFAGGATYGELARVARSTREAVKQKIRRLREKREGQSRR